MAFMVSFVSPLGVHLSSRSSKGEFYCEARDVRNFGVLPTKKDKFPYQPRNVCPPWGSPNLGQLSRQKSLQTVKALQENNETDRNPKSWQFAYVLTTVATALTGGRLLAAFSVLFLMLGRVVEAPVWLWGLCAGFSGALSDLIAIRFGDTPWDVNLLLPYFIFAAGNVTAATFDFDGFFGTLTPGASPENQLSATSQNSDSGMQPGKEDESSGAPTTDFLEWDKRMNSPKRHK